MERGAWHGKWAPLVAMIGVLLCSARVLAGAGPPPEIVDPQDDFEAQSTGPLLLSPQFPPGPPKWRSDDNLYVALDGAGNKVVQVPAAPNLGLLGTAWFIPTDQDGLPATKPQITQDDLTVSCEVNLQEDDLAENVGACFRSAAILVYRGGVLVTARVYVRLDDTGAATQFLEVIVLDTNNATREVRRKQIFLSAGKLQVAGRLEVALPAGSGNVTALFKGIPLVDPVPIVVGADKTTHVGIQVRRAANIDISSPTIDDLGP